jgi:hypothetical protein
MSMSTPVYADEHAVAGAVIGEACAIARRQNGPPVVGLAVGKHHTLVDVGPPMLPSFQVKARLALVMARFQCPPSRLAACSSPLGTS